MIQKLRRDWFAHTHPFVSFKNTLADINTMSMFLAQNVTDLS
jgi:hypothetical protein